MEQIGEKNDLSAEKSALLSKVQNLSQQLDTTQEELITAQKEIDKLRHLLHNANRKNFGKKSEKLSKEQVALFSFEAPIEPETEEVPVSAYKRKLNRGRKVLSEKLPRERREYEPEVRTCSCCGGELEKIGEVITEELEYIPAQLKIVDHVRIKRACPRCKSGVKIGKIPQGALPLPGARPGAGLLTALFINKYVDHLPFYRQEQSFLRLGVEIARQRMSDWLEMAVDQLFTGLWRVLKQETLKVSYVQADETSVEVRDLEVLETKGQLKTGYFWTVHAPPEKLVFFEYHNTRAGTAAQEVLRGFRGVVQTDAYAGYNPVLLPDLVVRLACMAHVRRKFVEARHSAAAFCDQVLKLIAELYVLEDKWKELEPDQRQERRQSVAKPKVAKLHEVILSTSSRLLPEHPLKKACQYALKQWTEVELYLKNGIYHIDNNAAERGIRPIAIGRKNYLFAGSHEAAQRAAIMYSFLGCCKLNGINPQEWLLDMFKKLPTATNQNLVEFLPHRWKKS